MEAHVFISGRVQGVFFRSNTRDKACELGISGWVRNLPDGRVEAVFQGGGDAVKEILEWCRRGPGYSRVSDVQIDAGGVTKELSGFEIRYNK